MVLVGVRKNVDKKLLSYASEHTPSLVIDCGKSLDLIPPFFPKEDNNVFFMKADLLYTLKDVLSEAGTIANSLGVKTIVITTFHKLFNFEEILENINIIQQLWELMENLGKDFDVLVGVHPNQESNALRYCG